MKTKASRPCPLSFTNDPTTLYLTRKERDFIEYLQKTQVYPTKSDALRAIIKGALEIEKQLNEKTIDVEEKAKTISVSLNFTMKDTLHRMKRNKRILTISEFARQAVYLYMLKFHEITPPEISHDFPKTSILLPEPLPSPLTTEASNLVTVEGITYNIVKRNHG